MQWLPSCMVEGKWKERTLKFIHVFFLSSPTVFLTFPLLHDYCCHRVESCREDGTPCPLKGYRQATEVPICPSTLTSGEPGNLTLSIRYPRNLERAFIVRIHSGSRFDSCLKALCHRTAVTTSLSVRNNLRSPALRCVDAWRLNVDVGTKVHWSCPGRASLL